MADGREGTPARAARAGRRGAGRASDGQGALYPRKDRQGRVVSYRWQIWLTDPATGRGYLKHGSAATERDARKELTRVARLRDEHRLPARASARDTVADLLERWLAGIRPEMDERSWRREEQNARLHLIPHLGAVKLDRLTVADVRGLRAKVADRAPATRTYIVGTLARALDQAVADGLLPYNVARLDKQRRRRKSARPATADRYAFTPPEVRRIVEGTRGEAYHALWTLLLYTGLREGEALALTWRDVDEAA